MKNKVKITPTKTVKGIIFPNIIETMIDLKIYKSQSDFLEKITRDNSGKSNSDKQLFRDIRKQGRDKSENKKIIKKMSQLLPNPAFTPKFSDLKNSGNWFTLKSCYEKLKTFESMKHMWPLSDYVIQLCDIEKSYINSIRKEQKFQIKLIEYWECFFFLDTELCKSAKSSLPTGVDSFSEEEFNIWKKENFKLLASVTIHQYMHITAIYEQDTYNLNRESCSTEQLEKQKMIIRLLPTIDANGVYCGAQEKLLNLIIKGYGFSNKNKFFKSLCRENLEEVDSIKKQYQRIKSKLTPDSLNTLLFRKKHLGNDVKKVPPGLIIACRICDEIIKELVEKKMELEWIVEEFSLYEKYQKQIKESIHTLLV